MGGLVARGLLGGSSGPRWQYYLELPEHQSYDRNQVSKFALLPTVLSGVAQDTSPLSTWAHVPADFSQGGSKDPRVARKTSPNANISQVSASAMFLSFLLANQVTCSSQRHCRRPPKV